jgi:two-component system, chemotaxis family, protein-glutamate methylesterase/glutaminase
MNERILRVLVVDDSAYVRKVIKQMLGRSPFIDVVGTARDGAQALELVEELHPDVVTLDLIMPGMGGLEFISKQMSRAPVPILIVSIANGASQLVLDALDAGAVDVIQKPSALISEKIFEMADDLVEKVKAAGNVRLTAVKSAPRTGAKSQAEPKPKPKPGLDVVVIGISTGGPQALKYLVPQFTSDFPVPIAIVMHMPVGYTELYAQRLNQLSPLEVCEAQEGVEIRKGCVLLAPAGRHLTFNRTPSCVVAHLDARPFDTLHRPSIDVLFRSAAETYGSGVLGVVMTGMGQDGKEGALSIKTSGGTIFAEAEESCVVFGMPRAVVEAEIASRTIPLHQMAEAIVEAAYGKNPHRR